MIKRVFFLLLAATTFTASGQISYFSSILLRQPSAAQWRYYLGIFGTNSGGFSSIFVNGALISGSVTNLEFLNSADILFTGINASGNVKISATLAGGGFVTTAQLNNASNVLQGQITTLATRATDLEAATNSLNTRVGNLEAATNAIQAALTALTTRVTNLEAATNALNTRVAALEASTNQFLTTNKVGTAAFTFAYSTNIDATVVNFISLDSANQVQVTSTNDLPTASNSTNTIVLTNLTKGASCSISFYGAQAPSTNFIRILVPSGSAIRWLTSTNGTSDFGVSSNKFGEAAFWCDRGSNVFGAYKESQ